MSDCIYTTDVVLDKDGYPRIKWKKRLWRLNRWLWTLVHGKIPDGLVVGHKCNNKGCINPNHFYLTTPEQNCSDAARDGLYFSGFHNKAFEHASKEWYTISTLYHVMGYSQQAIADLYGVHQSRISEIVRSTYEDYLDIEGVSK